MTTRLADRLNAARRRFFVGRAGEKALFLSALDAAEWPFQVLYIFGPGGVGKTSLLNEYTRLATEAGVPIHSLDARYIEATPDALLAALRQTLGLTPAESPLAHLGERPGRYGLLLDTCENLAALENWLTTTFLPEVPTNVLVVMASRQPSPELWRTDPGWQALVRVQPLRNLNPEESRTYLEQQLIPPGQYAAMLNFTHGHPLALSLVADVFHQRPEPAAFQPESTPDVVKTLLERFVQKVPGPAHRAALEACSLVRVTTESLLAHMLGAQDAHELFEWLRGLSFIEAGPHGLFPHDLAREAMAADVRWRNPEWYAELHRRARADYVTRMQRTTGAAQQQALFDLIFLHRDNAAVRPFFEWQTSGSIAVEPFREGDRPAVLAMVTQHEGHASARLAALWLARQPEHALVLRDAAGTLLGYMHTLALHAAAPEDREADPAIRAAWQYLQRHAPLRPGEAASHFRFWMARDTYQSVSAIQSLLFVNAVRHYLTTPGLAYHFFPCADPEFYAGVFAYADLARLPEADYEVGGRRYGAYGHDWRATPPAAWLTLLAERETAYGAAAPGTPRPASQLVVLSEADFAEAVRAALQDFTQPDLLRRNPLLRSRLVLERAGPQSDEAARSAALLALIRDNAATLLANPKDAKLFRAVEATYFKPAVTQEQAAEDLDLPFSTYRRHLKSGLTRLTDMLWQREIGAA
jgi:hypothetical protein